MSESNFQSPAHDGSAYSQIHSLAPSQAVGYRVEVHGTDGRVRVFPRPIRALRDKDKPASLSYFRLRPFQSPTGLPEGKHLLVFITSDGEPMPDHGVTPVLRYFPLSGAFRADGSGETQPSAKEAEPSPSLEQASRLATRGNLIRLGDAHTRNTAALLGNIEQISQDTADALRTVLEQAVKITDQTVKAANTLLEGYQKLMEAGNQHIERVAKMPPPQPPPPQDWAGVIRDGIHTIGDVASGMGVSRRKNRLLEASGKGLEIKETVPADESDEDLVDVQAEGEEETALAEKQEPSKQEPPKQDPPKQDPPKGGSAGKVQTQAVKPQSALKPKEDPQLVAKRALRRVLMAVASLNPGQIFNFIKQPLFLRRFLAHIRFLMFPVTGERWRARLAQ